MEFVEPSIWKTWRLIISDNNHWRFSITNSLSTIWKGLTFFRRMDFEETFVEPVVKKFFKWILWISLDFRITSVNWLRFKLTKLKYWTHSVCSQSIDSVGDIRISNSIWRRFFNENIWRSRHLVEKLSFWKYSR